MTATQDSSGTGALAEREQGQRAFMGVTDVQEGVSSGRLIIVSNRLPLSLTGDEAQLEFAPSAGGLATGLRTYFRSAAPAVPEHVWVGWPGRPVRPEQQGEVIRRC